MHRFEPTAVLNDDDSVENDGVDPLKRAWNI